VKALQLQKLLQDKEEKAQELQQIVSEREDKAEELQQILTERQERADGFTEAVERKMNSLVTDINTRLDQVEETIGKELSESRDSDAQNADGIQRSIDRVSMKMDSMEVGSDQFDRVKADLSEKIHAESVQSYRNLSELLKDVDERFDKMDALTRELKNVKSMCMGTLVMAIVNLVAVIVAILAALGVF
jgi:DNA repair exonuclease SbcCD ATPase subunit